MEIMKSLCEEGNLTATESSALQQTLQITGAPWSQQNGATAHTARGTSDSVTTVLPAHVTPRAGDIAWSATFPYLSAPNHVLHILRVRI
jgi:hypothetical protein